ncbi:hypothetical protein G7077_04525 [Sphingomonas piscis]|uniref:DUF2946 domain-containing protein n=1 Tax=Sphingomonas piscis TaxID=2714943 RepID=A0A6G7YNH0_9SPHN|nr:hypothetical protein [Sphingomonas piscis]QIK78277.1 hypothetical protein G7077_04525 [Sphingomonas piscis]
MRGQPARFAFAAILFALTVRLMVPTGWMPAPEGGFNIVPCIAAAPAPAAKHGHGGHDDHGKNHDSSKEHGKSADCVFAPLLASAMLPDLAVPTTPFLSVRTVPVPAPRGAANLPTGPPALPPPSTGPPALA